MSFFFPTVWNKTPSMQSIIASVEASERATYDYPALTKEFEDKCPADYPWMKKEDCRRVGWLWALQAGAMTEAPEIAFDNALEAACDRAKREGRLAAGTSCYATYFANHPYQGECTKTS